MSLVVASCAAASHPRVFGGFFLTKLALECSRDSQHADGRALKSYAYRTNQTRRVSFCVAEILHHFWFKMVLVYTSSMELLILFQHEIRSYINQGCINVACLNGVTTVCLYVFSRKTFKCLTGNSFKSARNLQTPVILTWDQSHLNAFTVALCGPKS